VTEAREWKSLPGKRAKFVPSFAKGPAQLGRRCRLAGTAHIVLRSGGALEENEPLDVGHRNREHRR
jgi:hypothetical protein